MNGYIIHRYLHPNMWCPGYTEAANLNLVIDDVILRLDGKISSARVEYSI